MMKRWVVSLGVCALLAGGCVGDGAATADDVDEEGATITAQLRVSERFEIDVPAGDVWSGLNDVNPSRPGAQVRVEVHVYYAPIIRWTDLGERLTSYRIITTGEEDSRGRTRNLTAATGVTLYRGVSSAFVLDGALYLVGESTGGIVLRNGTRRAPKPVVMGIAFNGRTGGNDRLQSVANIVPTDDPVNGRILVDLPSAEGFPVELDQDPGRPGGQAWGWFDTVSFTQRWSTGEAFACYNLMTTGAERNDGRSSFVGGNTPEQFRAPGGAFALNGRPYLLGERTGGATGAYARAPGPALMAIVWDGRANGNNAVDFSKDLVGIDSHALR